MRNIFFIITVLSITFSNSFSQSLSKQFRSLSRPEKIWVITHPFISKKCSIVSKRATEVANQVKKSNRLDTLSNGGQLDAFRHSFWMASLSQKIKSRKARKLGEAHEKGNFIDFKKRKLEEGIIPDRPSCEMDLWNNEQGIKIGKTYCRAIEEELISKVIEWIRAGEMRIIKRNGRGEFVDEKGNVLQPAQLKGVWEIPKVLVPSNYNPDKF